MIRWMQRVRWTIAMSLGLLAMQIASGEAAQRVVLQGNGRLVILAEDGSMEWERPWDSIHDLHRLPNGNLMVQQGKDRVVEIDIKTKEVVWTYDSAKQNGNAGKEIEVHAFQPLSEDRIMIVETTARRILEIDRAGKILKQIPLVVDHPHPHTDTRWARKLPSGNYLVCHEADGKVREYHGETGAVVWEYEIPLFGKPVADGHGPEAFGNKVFAALRLPNGNTLIATGNGHSVLEVTPEKEIVWQVHQNDLPGITLAWVTTLQVLENGHYLIGNCHAGPNQPLLIELEPKSKRVVWTLDRFDDFGNNVSNTLALEGA